MRIYPNSVRAVLAAAALVPALASAELAVTTRGVNMRAGPDSSYPRVAALGRGVQVDVIGCVEGWRWCDVAVGPNRGWVFAQYLSYALYDRPAVIAYGGPALGIPLVSFTIGPYWDNYYRGRPWYRNRHYWYSRPIARAPEWRAPPGWRAKDPGHHGNDWRNDDRHHRNRAHDRRGSHYSTDRGPDPRRNNDRE